MTRVHRSTEVPAPPGDVWELLVDDDERAGWFGGETALDPAPGGRGTFTEPDGTSRTATVEEVVPGRRLSWTWSVDGQDDDGAAPTRVEIDLFPSSGGTTISVTEATVAPRTARAGASPVSGLARAGGPLLDLEMVVLVRSHRVTAAR